MTDPTPASTTPMATPDGSPGGTPAGRDFTAETAGLRPQLLAHCYRMMGSPVEAEDQVQETYLRAWRAFHDFDGRSSVRTWMYRIATNTCLNALSSASRRVLPRGLGAPAGDPRAALNERAEAWLEPLPEAMLWSNPAPTPEEQLLARENITLAWATALQELSPNQRAVLLLRDVLAFSAEETAQTLGTTVASVNSALQRSRATVGDGLPQPGSDKPGTADDSARRGRSGPGEATDADTDRAVDDFIDAFERHDFDAVVASLTSESTWQMPPFDRWYRGATNSAVLAWTHCPAKAAGDLTFRKARANGQPALGMYLRKGDQYEAFQFLVLTIAADGRVGDVVGWFEPHLFRLAGLPLALDEAAA